MIPGFTAVALPADGHEASPGRTSVYVAGLWDDPGDGRTDVCVPTGTDTNCYVFTLWCTDNFLCRNTKTGQFHTESRTPYPCGLCGDVW
jgi:hypothetical protein